MKYKYVSHTAEAAYVAYGKDFSEALENAAEAMFNIMVDLKKIKKEREKLYEMEIIESADDEEQLVWHLLQRIISEADASSIAPVSLEIKSILNSESKFKIACELSYAKDSWNYGLLDIKAVTPHGLKVESKKGKVSISVVVDV